MKKDYFNGCAPKRKDLDEENMSFCSVCGEPFDMYDTEKFHIMKFLRETYNIDHQKYNSEEKQCKQCFFKNIVGLAREIMDANKHLDFDFALIKKQKKEDNMSEKTAKKIKYMETEIKVKDAIIQNLLFFITEQKIQIPEHVLKTITELYGTPKEIN